MAHTGLLRPGDGKVRGSKLGFSPPHMLSRMNAKEKEDRERGYSDLYFLTKDILGYDLLTKRTHQPLCDFFVQKDRTLSIERQDTIKRRLLLYPRHSFKSTLNVADCVQWIINFPGIRILILTAEDSLATAFVEEVKQHFTWDFKSPPTPFQALYPEFCFKPGRRQGQKTGDFTIPNRPRYFKEPTLWADSVTANLSGWHPDVAKLDDAVSDRNSTNPEVAKNVIKKMHLARKLLRPGGYWEMIGTRYNPFEAYGDTIENSGKELKLLTSPAMWLKVDPSHHVTPDDLRNFPEEDWELLFPEELDYKFLLKEFRDDEVSFFSQYMNDPLSGGAVGITIDDLRKATIPPEMLPAMGPVRWTWDLAYSQEPGCDFTAGIACRHTNGRMVVIDACRGRWHVSETAYQMVSSAKRWDEHSIGIEDSPGARFMEPEIMRVALACGWQMHIDWIPVESSARAKEKRFEVLQPMVFDGRLEFSLHCPFLDQIYKEFANFKTIEHKDLADACSRQVRYIDYSEVRIQADNAAIEQEIMQRDRNDWIYGRGKYQPKPLEVRRPNPWGLDDILGGLNG